MTYTPDLAYNLLKSFTRLITFIHIYEHQYPNFEFNVISQIHVISLPHHLPNYQVSFSSTFRFFAYSAALSGSKLQFDFDTALIENLITLQPLFFNIFLISASSHTTTYSSFDNGIFVSYKFSISILYRIIL